MSEEFAAATVSQSSCPTVPRWRWRLLGSPLAPICAPLNPAYSRREFEFYLSDLNPKALIVQSGHERPQPLPSLKSAASQSSSC